MALLEERTPEAPVADSGILRAGRIRRRNRRGPVLEMRNVLAAAAAAERTEAAGVQASRAAAQQTSCQVKSNTWSGHKDETQGCSAWNENAPSGCCCWQNRSCWWCSRSACCTAEAASLIRWYCMSTDRRATAEIREQHFGRCPDTGRGGFISCRIRHATIEASPSCRVQQPCEALLQKEKQAPSQKKSCMQTCR